jgi:dephospho-CoA kinase
MIEVGITGGIGSGKTFISRIFHELGFPVYYSDERAKNLIITNPNIVANLKNEFGEDIYFKSGQLNKEKLSSAIFNNKEAKEFVNQTVHPHVFEDYASWKNEHKTYSLVLKEAAILIETGAYKELDKIILVKSPIELRTDRILQRDGADVNKVRSVMNAQWDDIEKEKYSDYIIYNDQKNLLLPQIIGILNDLKIKHG